MRAYEALSGDRARTPSRWSERLPIAAAVVVGALIAARLAAYQLGVASAPWEPFFGEGARRVLHSPVSRALPVPDALLGAASYAVETVLVLTGGRTRWRTAPWLVLAYGALAAFMALTSATLVVLQPTVAHAFCTLCLASAAISFAVVPFALGEARHALRTVREEHRRGRSWPRSLLGVHEARRASLA